MERLGVFSFHACHSRGACAGLDPVAGIRKSMVMGDGSVNILYGMGRTDGTFRDQFIGTLNQARFHKMSKRHDLALECVDEVLAADPDFPEALFLKAQILWEGYQDAAAAKK